MSSPNTPPMSIEKQILLYTASTPNGVCASILLEELKSAYPDFDYDYHRIELAKNVQKESWFIELNPNGRIPVIVDRSRNNFPVFETSAILLYLAQHYDKEYKFWFNSRTEADDHSTMMQWLFFAHGGIGPMQGQSNHFRRSAPQDIPYAKNRYVNETKRLYGVLEIRLNEGDGHGRDYLAGPDRGKYSLADIKSYSWVRLHAAAGIPSLDEWPCVKNWVDRCESRAALQDGLKIGQ